MKNLLVMSVFVFLASVVSGQQISKGVQNRLNSITNAVQVTNGERKQLTVAIQKLIDKDREIRSAKREHMELELRENSLRYLTEVLIILDDERYEKWQMDVQRNNRRKK